MSSAQQLPEELRGLALLAGRKDLDLKPVLLRVITDLFVGRAHHSREDIEQYQAIAEGLIPQADESIRVSVAEKLADHALAPPRVLQQLLSFGGSVAAPILTRSTGVAREQLATVAREGSATDAAHVATRTDLDPGLVHILAGRDDIEVLRALSRNPTAPIDRSEFDRLVRSARHDRVLARALCTRAREAQIVAPLFLYATQMQREAIILAARRADLGDIRTPSPATDFQSTVDEIERAASAQDPERVAAIIARVTGGTIEMAREIIADSYGEPLALVLAMLHASAPAATRILISLDAAAPRSYDRIQALTYLVTDVPQATAERLVRLMTGAPRSRLRSPATHAPATDVQAAETPSRPQLTSAPAPAPASAPPRKFIFFRRA